MALASPQGGSLQAPNNDTNPSGISHHDEIVVQKQEGLVHHRIFVGPMPEKIIAHGESQGKKKKINIGSVLSLGFDTEAEGSSVGHGDKSEDVSRVLKENALRFFIHRGGNIEDWGEEAEQNILEDMVKHWKESEWGQLWHRRHHRRKKEPQRVDQWFGKSFEIGNLLGLNMMEESGHLTERSQPLPSSREPEPVVAPDAAIASNLSVYPTTATGQTFVTANSEFSENVLPEESRIPESSPQAGAQTGSSSPASSHMGLLQKQRDIEARAPGPSSKNVGASLLSIADTKGKAKVHYSDTSVARSTSQRPVPAEEVLSRTKDTVERNTSLAATVTEDADQNFRWGDALLKGNGIP